MKVYHIEITPISTQGEGAYAALQDAKKPNDEQDTTTIAMLPCTKSLATTALTLT